MANQHPSAGGVAVPLRKTARRWSPAGGVHYLTFSCYRRLPLLGTPRLRDEFVEMLAAARQKHRFKLVAWVVMPEHIHIILVPTASRGCERGDEEGGRGSALPSILIGLKKPIAAKVLARWSRLRWNNLSRVTDGKGRLHFWQPGGGFDRNVRDADELAREIRYIHRNPVERGLVEHPIDWPWSSARWYAGWENGVPAIDEIVFDRCDFPGPRPEVYI